MSPLPAIAVAFGIQLATPAAVCTPERTDWTAAHPVAVEAFASSVAQQLTADLKADDFGRHHARFDGEWWLGAYAMAATGFGQAAQSDPASAARNGARASSAVTAMLRPPVRRFDTVAWGTDMFESLHQPDQDHAVLGYVGVALGMERLANPDSTNGPLHDAVVAALSQRLATRAPGDLLQTYPGESYPVDNAAVAAAIALHAQATGDPVPAWFPAWLEGWEARWVDPQTGLVVQSVSPSTGLPMDHPRGSGTALSAWFLVHADPALSARLGAATRDQLGTDLMGYAAVREYPDGRSGVGDIDSGPLVFGLSISASGFSIGAARAAGDPTWQSNLLDTACLFAAPADAPSNNSSVTGGVLGDAILLAMLTTPVPKTAPPTR